MKKTVIVMGLLLGISSLWADPGIVISPPVLMQLDEMKLADGDVMRMMADWKKIEHQIITMQNDKADPKSIGEVKRQANNLKRKIEDLSQGSDVRMKAWAKTQDTVKALRDKGGLVQYPDQERDSRKADISKYYDGQLKEQDDQLRVAEENHVKRIQQIGMAGLAGTMDQATKYQEKASANQSISDFRDFTASEKNRIRDEKAAAIAAVK